jgi:hypothetical protein
MPWLWPDNFPECDDAKELREFIEECKKNKWPEIIEALYEQKLHELRFDVYQEAAKSDQAWTHPDYFKIWYNKFRLLKSWFYDPCLERTFFSTSSYFNALIEKWGKGLVYLNHAWKATRGFFPMMLK